MFVIRNTLFLCYRKCIDLSVSFADISKMNEKKMKGKNKEECRVSSVSALHTSMKIEWILKGSILTSKE